MKILITGTNGYVGKSLYNALKNRNALKIRCIQHLNLSPYYF